MKNETKLTAQDLALYLGCEVEWMGERGYTLAGINTGQSNFNKIGLVWNGIEVPLWAKQEEVKPILRPPSSITEAEMKDNHEAYKVAASGLGKLAHGSAASTRHWLSLHIDLFGWIEAGLAIDKTKIETK